MSVHSENCVSDGVSSDEADAACADMFDAVTAIIQGGGTLSSQQLEWAVRHGGLPSGATTATVTRWLRDRRQ